MELASIAKVRRRKSPKGLIIRVRNEMSDLSRRKRSLLEIKDEKKVLHKMDEITADVITSPNSTNW